MLYFIFIVFIFICRTDMFVTEIQEFYGLIRNPVLRSLLLLLKPSKFMSYFCLI